MQTAPPRPATSPVAQAASNAPPRFVPNEDDGVGTAVHHLDAAINGLAPGTKGASDEVWASARDSAWQAVDGLRTLHSPDDAATGAITAAKSGIANLEENLRKLANGSDAFIDYELFSGNVAGAVTHFTTARDLLTGDSDHGSDGFL
ncbi:MAG: hypothetical protein JWM25_1277 [Thermoleophilia bacterium]|nr:hypothetical protein [Thermoleophilia bacterium]MCZ4496694.1 hypothetical protein [Thermoleophilia bacterium]